MGVPCSSCSLFNFLESHSSQLARVLIVQALQTLSKGNARALQTSIKQNKRSRKDHRKIQNFSNYRLKMMPILEVITLCRRCRRQDTTEASRLPQNTTFLLLLACLAQRLFAVTSRCRTDKAGQGALEPLPEDGARTKRFDREITVPRIPYWGRDEKELPTKSLSLSKEITIYVCKLT